MKNDQTIPAFLEVLQTKPELFSIQDLQDFLAQTPDSLEYSTIDAGTKSIQDWYKQRAKIRDEVRLRKSNFREIKGVNRNEKTEDDMSLKNRYRELRQAVEDQIKSQQPNSENKSLNDENKGG